MQIKSGFSYWRAKKKKKMISKGNVFERSYDIWGKEFSWGEKFVKAGKDSGGNVFLNLPVKDKDKDRFRCRFKVASNPNDKSFTYDNELILTLGENWRKEQVCGFLLGRGECYGRYKEKISCDELGIQNASIVEILIENNCCCVCFDGRPKRVFQMNWNVEKMLIMIRVHEGGSVEIVD